MANAENKTKETGASVEQFLNSIADEQQRSDAQELRRIMEKITGRQAAMWGSSIVGCGTYHYKYESGREGDAGVIGFAPRKNALTIYIANGYDGFGPLLEKLGKHSIGKACLYIKRLSDVDVNVLQEIMKQSIAYMKATYPTNLK